MYRAALQGVILMLRGDVESGARLLLDLVTERLPKETREADDRTLDREASDLYLMRSQVHAAIGDWESALADASAAIASGPGNGNAYLQRAELSFRTSRRKFLSDISSAINFAGTLQHPFYAYLKRARSVGGGGKDACGALAPVPNVDGVKWCGTNNAVYTRGRGQIVWEIITREQYSWQFVVSFPFLRLLGVSVQTSFIFSLVWTVLRHILQINGGPWIAEASFPGVSDLSEPLIPSLIRQRGDLKKVVLACALGTSKGTDAGSRWRCSYK